MERTWKPTTAGILNIVAGTMGIVGGIFLIAAGRVIEQLGLGGIWTGAIDIPATVTEAIGVSPGVISALGAIPLVFGIIALVGGIFALQRKTWGLALTGSIFAMFISGVLGILSIVFVSLGKREFD